MNAMGPHPSLERRPDAGWSLCQLVTDWNGKVPAGGAIVEPKIDGIRMLYIDGELCTREGATIHGADHIADVLERIEDEQAVPMFFDGEWQVGGSFDRTLSHFQAVGARGNAGVLHLFDAIPMRVWRGEDPSETLEVRRGKVDRMALPHLGPALDLVPWAFMTDAANISDKAGELMRAGGEGVVIKHALSTYRRSRGANWQRIKRNLTKDLLIVGATPQRENGDSLGALVVLHGGSRVNVAAGFTDAERLELWRRRESLVGTIAEVEAMEVTERGSLRQARFVRLRGDKGKAIA